MAVFNVPEEKPLWFEVKKNKNKALLLCCLACWSVCILSYAYQFLGGFVHWPYWIIVHLLALGCSIIPTIIGMPPFDTPPSIPMQLTQLLVALMPLLAKGLMPGSDSATPRLDWLLLVLLFFAVDAQGCLFIASLTRLKYTQYWTLIALLLGLVFTSAYGLHDHDQDPMSCKIAVCCSAASVAALSTLYLYLRRSRLVSNESHRLTFSRCFV